MIETKIKYYVEKNSFWTSAALIFMLLSIIFRGIGCWGLWNDREFLITQIILPIASGLLFILLLAVLGRHALWTTFLPVLGGVAFFVLKALKFENTTQMLLCLLLYAAVAILYCGTVFTLIRTKWLLPPLFGIPFVIHIARDLPRLSDTANPVTFSAGMAKDGMLPFCNIYSAFAQRAYDNIIHDAAILNLPLVLCLDRAGLVGEDGPTHHGAFDIPSLRTIPNITIASPMNEQELRHLMYTAQLPGMGPFVIRYPRGRGVCRDWRCPMQEIGVGTGRKLHEGSDIAVLSLGPIGNHVTQVIEELEKEGSTPSIAHYDMRFAKPLDENLLQEIASRFQRIVTIEDGSVAGGFGSAVMEWMSDHGHTPVIRRLGLTDHFIEHGKVSELQQLAGIDPASIKQTILSL